MPSQMNCPHCYARLMFPDSMVGQMGRCRGCRRAVRLTKIVPPQGGEERWSGLEQRLERIEKHLGLWAEPVAVQTETAMPQAALLVAKPIPCVLKAEPPPEEILEAQPVLEPPQAEPPISESPRWEWLPPPAAHSEPSEPEPPEPKRNGTLEQTIGLKWAAWVGAIVLVIGCGLGIKYAYDQRWFEYLSPAWRLLFMSLGGFALLAVGELVHRKVNIVSAAALFGSGVAVLFLVSYAGVYYDVYDRETAFFFVAATTIIGTLVTIRSRLVTVAILSQIGGHLAPYLLNTGQQPGVSFFAYLLMLQLVAVSLAQWGNSPKWWLLRVLSLGCTAFWVALALLGRPETMGLQEEGLWFTLLYALIYQNELLWSALRTRLTPPTENAKPGSEWAKEGWGAVFSLAVTFGLTLATLFVLQIESPAIRGTWVLAFAGAVAVPGFLMPSRGNKRLESILISFRVQAFALLILSVPVILSSIWISLAWGVLAVALAFLGARFNRVTARIAALAAWALSLGALLREIAMGGPDGPIHVAWLNLFGQDIQAGVVLGWLMAVAGQVIAWLTRRDYLQADRVAAEHWRTTANLTSVFSVVVWANTSMAGLPLLGATFAMLAFAWVLMGTERVAPRRGFGLQGLGLLGFVALKWLVVDSVAYRYHTAWDFATRGQELATWLSPLGVPLQTDTLLGWLIAFSIQALVWFTCTEWFARLHEKLKIRRQLGVLIGLISCIVWVRACMIGLPWFGATFAILLFIWALLAAARLEPRVSFGVQAIGLFTFLSLKWLFVDTIAHRVGATAEQLGEVATWLTVLGQAIQTDTLLGGMIAITGQAIIWQTCLNWLLRSPEEARLKPQTLLVIGLLSCVVWVTACIAGLPLLGATLAILVFAWALMAAAQVEPRAAFGMQSLALFAFLSLKWLVVDAVAYRIASPWDKLAGGEVATWFMWFGQPIQADTLLGWIIAITGQAIIWLTCVNRLLQSPEEARGRQQTTLAIGLISCIVFVTASMIGLPLLGATLAMLVFVWALCGMEYLQPRAGFAIQALALLAFAAAKWMVVDTLAHRLDPNWDALSYLPIWNPSLGLGVLLAGSLAGVLWLGKDAFQHALRRGQSQGGILTDGVTSVVVFLAVVALATFGLSFEVDRFVERAIAVGVELAFPIVQFKLLSLTILWSLAVVVLALAQRWSGSTSQVAWVLLGILGLKFLLIDTIPWYLEHMWTAADRFGIISTPVMANLQGLTALTLLGAAVLIARFAPLAMTDDPRQSARLLRRAIIHLAILVVGWTGMMEIERTLHHLAAVGLDFGGHPRLFIQLCWSIWSVVVVLGFLAAVRHWSRSEEGRRGWYVEGWLAMALLAVKFLTVDTLIARFITSSQPWEAPSMMNLQFLTGLAVLGGLLALRRLAPVAALPEDKRQSLVPTTCFLGVLVGLWMGTLELDRLFGSAWASTLHDARLAKFVAISIYWSIYAIGSVAAGFRYRWSGLRYFGLALFAVTLFKVGVFDLQQVQYGYRVLSFFGLGLLLLGTSVLYGKLSPKILAQMPA